MRRWRARIGRAWRALWDDGPGGTNETIESRDGGAEAASSPAGPAAPTSPTGYRYARIAGRVRLVQVIGTQGSMLLCRYDEQHRYGGRSGTHLIREQDIMAPEIARREIEAQRESEAEWFGEQANEERAGKNQERGGG